MKTLELLENALWHLSAHDEGRASMRTDEMIPALREAIKTEKQRVKSLGGTIRFIGETWQGFVAAGELKLKPELSLPADRYLVLDYVKKNSGDFSRINDVQLTAFGDLKLDWENEASETLWHDCMNPEMEAVWVDEAIELIAPHLN